MTKASDIKALALREGAMAPAVATDAFRREAPPLVGHDPVASYLNNLSPGSQRAQHDALQRLCGLPPSEFAWERLRYEHTNVLRAELVKRYAPATTRRMLSALRRVLRECWKLRLMSADDYQVAIDLAKVKNQRLPRGRALERTELAAMAQACREDPSPAGRRDLALLIMLYGSGVRRAEAAALTIADYNPMTGAVQVRHGKGDKERVDHIPPSGRDGIEGWLDVRGGTPGSMFVPILRGGKLGHRHVTGQAIYLWICNRADAAHVQRPSPHDFRRTFASDLLDTGADLVAVQTLMGHGDPRTTSRYDRRGDRSRAASVDKLDMGWAKE